MASIFTGKRIFITGVCGTIGQELLAQLLTHDPAEIRGIDTNETTLFTLYEKYQHQDKVQIFLGDIRDREKMLYQLRGMHIVFHTAALKHVLLSERSPRDAVATNVLGIQNVIEAAVNARVERFLFTSSDKAVNPTNVMGTTKLLGERLVTATNSLKVAHGPVFSSVRFGNVLGSSGSVVPIFKEQISRGGPVTLTDERMTRFVMTTQESIRLMIDSIEQAKGGEVFVTKMPIIRIADLAQVMIEELAPRYGFTPEQIKINVVGSKPGEKLYEELLSEEETPRSIELEKYYVVTPAFTSAYHDINYNYDLSPIKRATSSYRSDLNAPISKETLRSYLIAGKLL
jgi:FlaA1/EpsC-like NDP-sugar epimerase